MISGLFALATIMLLLVIAVVILLAALFLYLGAKLAKIERVSYGKALVATVAASVAYGLVAWFAWRLPGAVAFSGGAAVAVVLAAWLFQTSYGKALVAGVVQVVGLALVALVFVLLPDSVVIPFLSLIIFQGPDPDYQPHLANPAYTEEHPTVLIDEAHFNYHTMDGSFRGFADLMLVDGYLVTPNTAPFTLESLSGHDVLVIVNARGGENQPGRRGEPAFTEAECDTVLDWVLRGGSLLLVADHAPYGSAAQILADRFGIEMSKGFTEDPEHNDGSDGELVFSRENGLLTEHSITRGRDAGERLSRVVSYSGQSLRGPPDGIAVLRLADSAVNVTDEDRVRTSAAGGAQGIALELGEGRVFVLAEAAMLTAQVVRMPFAPYGAGGVHSPDTDNEQFALNLLHWLSRLLE